MQVKLNMVVANILRSSSDSHARAFDRMGILRRYLVGARRLTAGIDRSRQRRFPVFGLCNFIAAKLLSSFQGECVRFALAPLFEQWVRRQLEPGDSLLAGLGYLNRCLEDVKKKGGLAFLEARNSHPSNFWSFVAEEHARWGCPLPPIWPRHHLRQQRSVALADFIFVPSRFVKDSFAARGFPTERLLYLPYPVDLKLFRPAPEPRPGARPLTIVSTGLLTLRKGSPYLFEAFKLIQKEVPNARLRLIRVMSDSFRSIYKRKGYDRLPVEWSDTLPHPRLLEWLQESDVFCLPTIEEGMVRSAVEALACGLPVVTTPNAGVDEFIQEGLNGSMVPIRDPQAIARTVLAWWERIRNGQHDPSKATPTNSMLGFDAFEKTIAEHMKRISLINDREPWAARL